MALRKKLAIGLGACFLSGALTGTTLSLWQDEANEPLGLIQAGELDISFIDAEPTWSISSSDIAPSPLPIDPTTYLATPGDSFLITQPFRLTLKGDNNKGSFVVSWNTPPSLPDGVSATYRILDLTDAEVIAPTPLGTSSTPFELMSSPHELILEITLTYDRSKDNVMVPTSEISSLGLLDLSYKQVRSGGGFS